VLDAALPVALWLEVSFHERFEVALKTLTSEERIVFGFVDCEEWLGLFGGDGLSFLFKQLYDFAEFIALEIALQPDFEVSELLVEFGLFAEETDEFLQAVCLDNLIISLQSLLSFQNSFVDLVL
jgi:hypothetical protein